MPCGILDIRIPRQKSEGLRHQTFLIQTEFVPLHFIVHLFEQSSVER